MWRSTSSAGLEDFVFQSSNGTPIDGHNFLRRVLQPRAREAGITGITFQALRRTFATHFQAVGTVKDAQAQLRHTNASTTLNVYTQSIPASVQAAVEALDHKLCDVLNTSEHKYEM